MNHESRWPKGPTSWIENERMYISVPFTWNMPKVRELLRWYTEAERPTVTIGGPGVYLALHFYPDYLDVLNVKGGLAVDRLVFRLKYRKLLKELEMHHD